MHKMLAPQAITPGQSVNHNTGNPSASVDRVAASPVRSGQRTRLYRLPSNQPQSRPIPTLPSTLSAIVFTTPHGDDGSNSQSNRAAVAAVVDRKWAVHRQTPAVTDRIYITVARAVMSPHWEVLR